MGGMGQGERAGWRPHSFSCGWFEAGARRWLRAPTAAHRRGAHEPRVQAAADELLHEAVQLLVHERLARGSDRDLHHEPGIHRVEKLLPGLLRQIPEREPARGELLGRGLVRAVAGLVLGLPGAASRRSGGLVVPWLAQKRL